jgi:hypothetical protein
MKSWLTYVVGALVLGALAWCARETWQHLQAGYQLQAGFEGGPLKAHQVVFPLSHKILAVAAFSVLAIGTVLGALVRPGAFVAFVAGIVAVTGLRLYDVSQYGSIGAPTPQWSGVFIVAMVILAVAGRKLGILR